MTWLQIDDNFEEHAKVAPLSDAAHRLWMRAATWCKKPANAHTRGFVPRALLRVVAQNSAPQAKLEKLADELVNARGGGIFEHGLWEPVDGGWRFHDWDAWQRSPAGAPSAPVAKSEAGRLGGLRSAAARRERNGSAQPKQTRSTEAPASDVLPKHRPEASPKQPEASASEASPKHAEAPIPDPDPEIWNARPEDLTGFPRARGARPSVRADLLPEKLTAKAWEPPSEFRDYALELGLSEQQFADVVTDLREKITRAAELPWLASQLCRFIETRAERLRRKARGELGLVSGDAPRQASPPAVEGEVAELVPGEPPKLPEPLKWKSWECGPDRFFSRGKDSEGGIWTLDEERRLRRKAPPPRLVEAPEAVEVGKPKGNGKPARTKPPEAPAARSGGAGS